MKRTINLSMSIATLLLISNLSFGQNKNALNNLLFNNSTVLDGNSFSLIKTFNVPEDTSTISLTIESKVKEGNVVIKITDPNKKSKGEFLVYAEGDKLGKFTHSLIFIAKNQVSKNPKLTFPKHIDITKSEINKTINLPLKGKWTLEIQSKKAKGSISIKTNSVN